MSTKLSRRYFAGMLGLSAVAAAVGSNVLAAMTETAVEKAEVVVNGTLEFCKKKWAVSYVLVGTPATIYAWTYKDI
jgi:hypothetical protein